MNRRRAQSPVRWVIGVAVILSVALAALLLYRYMRPVVTVTDAVEGPVVQAFYATGTLQPVREFDIKAHGAGTLEQVLVDKGDHVTKGQALAVMTDSALQFVEKQAEAELAEKKARAEEGTSPVLHEFATRAAFTNDLLQTARREEARVTRLLSQDAASQSDLDRAIDRVKELGREAASIDAQLAVKRLEVQKELRVAEEALKIARWNVGEQTLRSPTDGVVLDRPVAQGTRLAVNDHVMQVADVRPENLVMRAAVDEEDVIKVRLGGLVRMTLYSFADAEPFTGRVTRVYDKADPERRTFEVDVALQHPDPHLAAGMTGELAFIVEEKDKSIVVPAQAWQGGHVYTVRDGRLAVPDVKIGLRGVERVEVLSGLQPGDRVLVSPVGDLAPGRAVREQFMDPTSAAGLNKPKVKETFKGFN